MSPARCVNTHWYWSEEFRPLSHVSCLWDYRLKVKFQGQMRLAFWTLDKLKMPKVHNNPFLIVTIKPRASWFKTHSLVILWDLSSPRIRTLWLIENFIVWAENIQSSQCHLSLHIKSIIQKIGTHIFLSLHCISYPWGKGSLMVLGLLIFHSVIFFFWFCLTAK